MLDLWPIKPKFAVSRTRLAKLWHGLALLALSSPSTSAREEENVGDDAQDQETNKI